jgi:LacI family transcriptional regulator
MPSGTVTITDVARLAGVSISTVSRVINNSMPVSDELRKSVLKAMEELNFKPNILAQNLRRRLTSVIGVIIPDIRFPAFDEVVKGVEDTCIQNEHTVLLSDSNSDPEREIINAELFERQQVDGIVFAGIWGWEQQEHIARLCENGMPICLVNRDIDNLPVDQVSTSNERGEYLAVSHLIDLGHRVIGCAALLPTGGIKKDELSGYRQALADAGYQVREDLITNTTPSYSSGVEAGKRLLQQNTRPTAIFARSDQMAIGVIKAALDMGLKVPEDLSVIGYGDIPISQYFNPPLSTIRMPRYEMGVKAALMLLERIEKKNLPQRQAIFEPHLVVRTSTTVPKEIVAI